VLSDFLSKLLVITGTVSLESTIEVNPETVTDELLSILEQKGIDRISMGIQSLNNSVLKILGRNTTLRKSLYALEKIKNNWKGSFSVDLINTVPDQTVKMALADIVKASEFKPDHFSLYSLSFEPDTVLYKELIKGKISSVPEKTDTLMQEESVSLLHSLEYNRYEVSNYAKQGKESLHNINYWNMGSYLGVGPSAASTLLTSGGPVRIEYKRSISDFLQDSIIENRILIEHIKPESFLLEHLMMGLRLKKGIDILHINKVFTIDIEDFLNPLFKQWKNFLKIEKGTIYLTEEGLSLLNPFLIDIASLIDKNNLQINAEEINWPILTAQF